MGKFMQWTSAIILYFGLSLATFNRSLDPKDGTYAEKGTDAYETTLKGDAGSVATQYSMDWSQFAKAKVKVNA